MALLEVKNIYKSFGGVKAIQDFSLAADAGQIHGIIGPNGAGIKRPKPLPEPIRLFAISVEVEASGMIRPFCAQS